MLFRSHAKISTGKVDSKFGTAIETGQADELVRGRTMLVVTHEMDFARHVANRVVFMEQGVIVEQNTAEAFFNDPQQPRTQEFLQTYKQRSLL